MMFNIISVVITYVDKFVQWGSGINDILGLFSSVGGGVVRDLFQNSYRIIEIRLQWVAVMGVHNKRYMSLIISK